MARHVHRSFTHVLAFHLGAYGEGSRVEGHSSAGLEQTRSLFCPVEANSDTLENLSAETTFKMTSFSRDTERRSSSDLLLFFIFLCHSPSINQGVCLDSCVFVLLRSGGGPTFGGLAASRSCSPSFIRMLGFPSLVSKALPLGGLFSRRESKPLAVNAPSPITSLTIIFLGQVWQKSS